HGVPWRARQGGLPEPGRRELHAAHDGLQAGRGAGRGHPAGLQAGDPDPLRADGAEVLKMSAVIEPQTAGGDEPAPPAGAVTVTVRIHRYNPEISDEPEWQSFDVPALPTDRVLNLLHHIKWYRDGSLTFRRSCAHGVCGSDAIRINGTNRLAC